MKFVRRMRYWLRARQNDADVAEEMEFHRAMAGNIGNTTQAREDARAVWIWPWLESVMQDLRYALRNLRSQPGFAAMAILALGTAIGFNTSLFSVFNAVALRPWPVKDPARVQNIAIPDNRGNLHGLSLAEVLYLSENSKTFSGFAATMSPSEVMLDDGKAQSSSVTGNFFRVLGVDLQLGRGFLAEEDALDAPAAVAIISDRFWRNRLSADPNAIGRKIHIEDVPFTIVGVASQSFTGTSPAPVDLYVPMSAGQLVHPHDAWIKNFLRKPQNCCVQVAGRLAPDVTRAQATTEMTFLTSRFWEALHEKRSPVVLTNTVFLANIPRDAVMPTIVAMFTGMTLVLLLACANVGNLLVARAWARRPEIMVRLSVGASRSRIVRQLLTESLLLAVAAGALGVGLAYWLPVRVVHAVVPMDIDFSLSPDTTVLMFALGLIVATCLMFGLAPALHGTRPSAMESRHWLRSILLSAQVALSVALLIGASLLMRGVQTARTKDPGFAIDGISVASFELPASSYDAARAAALFKTLSHDLQGFQSGLAWPAPLTNVSRITSISLPGDKDLQHSLVNVIDVSAGYFNVLHIPILAGRNFDTSDENRHVVLINQTLARFVFKDQDPRGRQLGPNEVIGVVRDASTTSLGQIEPTLYFPIGNNWTPLVLFPTSPEAIASLSAAVKRIEPRARVVVTSLSANAEKWMLPARAGSAIAATLAVFALALATIGIFGVFSYLVEQRTKEIGIRIALGARTSQIVRLVLGASSRPLLVGLVLGFAAAMGVSRLLIQFLYGVSPFDPLANGAVAATLAIAGLAASYLPARRATKIDPIAALRCE